MIKYRCQLCGRIHYGRIGLKAGHCTTCGPKGGLIIDVNWVKVTKAMKEATNSIRELGICMSNLGRKQ